MADEDNDKLRLPDLKTDAARQARRAFERDVVEMLSRERQVSFNILVWGMSLAKDSPIARKRRDIAKQLIDDGHNAMFSEDLVHLGRGKGLSEASKELAQAQAADLVIALVEGSPGALAEVCDFCVRPDIVHKVLILAPDGYKTGYPGAGDLRDLDHGYGAVHWYQPHDVVTCDLLTQACKRVQARRSIVYRHGPGSAR